MEVARARSLLETAEDARDSNHNVQPAGSLDTMNEIPWNRIAAIAFVLRILLFIPLTVGLTDGTQCGSVRSFPTSGHAVKEPVSSSGTSSG